MNSGPYMFVEPHISRILKELNKKDLKYAGRRSLAMTAVGSSEIHSRESKQLTEFLLQLIK
jgi:2-oxoglutarate dehydrogenase complex dehydrogenase (E1) component-like enzyme